MEIRLDLIDHGVVDTRRDERSQLKVVQRGVPGPSEQTYLCLGETYHSNGHESEDEVLLRVAPFSGIVIDRHMFDVQYRSEVCASFPSGGTYCSWRARPGGMWMWMWFGRGGTFGDVEVGVMWRMGVCGAYEGEVGEA